MKHSLNRSRKLGRILAFVAFFQLFGNQIWAQTAIGFDPNDGRVDPTKRTGGLTDQEKITSDTYVHQGLSQKTLEEECTKEFGAAASRVAISTI